MGRLEIMGISKSFGANRVLEEVSFSVEEGEFVSILGPSGSGKSTLFHIIGGILLPDQGEIFLDGKNIVGKRGSISYTPQSPSLLPWRTVLENVLLGQELVGMREEERAKQMLEKAGLHGFENAYPHELSGGMKQRVSFIRSLLSPQPLICLDEPFSALDEFTRIQMQKWLQNLWMENRRSVLFITHNIEEALFLSDKIIIMSKKPSKVERQIPIPFLRPRKEDIILTEEFLAWKREIYNEIAGQTGSP